MATKFRFTDAHINILKNFTEISKSMLIEPDKLSVINDARSVIAKYEYDTPFDFEPFGLYDCDRFISNYKAINKPEIDVHPKYINIIGANNDKIRLHTTASDLVPKVPDIESKCAKVDFELVFNMSAEILSQIRKVVSAQKSQYIFFETNGKRIILTLCDALEASSDNYEIPIEDGIKANNLTKPVKIALADFLIMDGDYEVKISEKLTRWSNLNNVVYYITTDTKKK